MKNILLSFFGAVPILILLNMMSIDLSKRLNNLYEKVEIASVDLANKSESPVFDVVVPSALEGIKYIYAHKFVPEELRAESYPYVRDDAKIKKEKLKMIIYGDEKEKRTTYVVEKINSLGLEKLEVKPNSWIHIVPKIPVLENDHKSLTEFGTIRNDDTSYVFKSIDVGSMQEKVFKSIIAGVYSRTREINGNKYDYESQFYKDIESKEMFIQCSKDYSSKMYVDKMIQRLFIESCFDMERIVVDPGSHLKKVSVIVVDKKESNLFKFNKWIQNSNTGNLSQIDVVVDTSFYKKYYIQLEKLFTEYQGEAELRICFK